MPDENSTVIPAQDFRRLSDTVAGREPDTALRRDVSDALAVALRAWINRALRLHAGTATRAALRLNLSPAQGRSFTETLVDVHQQGLLDVVHAVLALHPHLDEVDPAYSEPTEQAVAYMEHVIKLADHLEDAGSAYKVGAFGRKLVERVDPTVTKAVEKAEDNAPEQGATYLRNAWNEAYGLHPDPNTAYRDAIRAVEEIACPLVLPKSAQNSTATLGTVLRHLREAEQKWQFVLLTTDDKPTIEPIVAMLDRLWTGNVARHGGGGRSRDHTKAEAEAAVHLAATLVQLLSTGALTPRGGS